MQRSTGKRKLRTRLLTPIVTAFLGGTVALGAVGMVIGAKILSDLLEDLGIYLGGLDYDPGTTIEDHIERGR